VPDLDLDALDRDARIYAGNLRRGAFPDTMADELADVLDAVPALTARVRELEQNLIERYTEDGEREPGLVVIDGGYVADLEAENADLLALADNLGMRLAAVEGTLAGAEELLNRLDKR
jgi:hypothetical protein